MSYRGRRRKRQTLQILWIVAALVASAGLIIGYKLGFSEEKGEENHVVNAAGNEITEIVEASPTLSPLSPTTEPTTEPTLEPTPVPTEQGPFQVHNPEDETKDTTQEDKGNVLNDNENQQEPTAAPENTQKMVALTFDDGPFPKVTNRILDILEEYDVKATFFIMGDRINLYSETIQKEYDQGHQIASHTYSHKNLTKLSEDKIKYEAEYPNELLNSIVDVGDVYIRPPYGANNELVRSTIKVPLILWSVDSEDWKSKNKDTIFEEVMTHVKDGDIILMHDLYTTTADAVELVVPELIKQGYKLVTVEELLKAKGIEPEGGVIYHNGR